MINILINSSSLLILLVFFLTGSIPKTMDPGFILLILSILMINVISFFFFRYERNNKLKKQFLSISFLFTISFLIVHFQTYLDFLLGNLDIQNRFLWVKKETVPKGMLISAIGLLSFFVGYSLKSISKVKPLNEGQNNRFDNPKILFFLGIGLLMVFYLTVNSAYLKGDYSNSSAGGVAIYCALMFEAVIYSIIILNCRNAIILKRKLSVSGYLMLQKYPLILLLIYIPTILLIGDRGPIIYLSLAFALGYVYVTQKRFSFVLIMAIILVASIVMNIVGLARRIETSSGFSSRVEMASNETELSYYPSSISNSTRELASSVRTVHMAVDYIEAENGHFNGLFFAQDLMLLVPGLRNTIITYFDVPKPYTSSSQLLTYQSQGRFSTWGVGTSCIADTYLDFGLLGILIIYFLFGVIVRIMELEITSGGLGNLYLVICAFLVFSFSIYISRSTLLYSLNKFTYIAVFCNIPRLIKRKK